MRHIGTPHAMKCQMQSCYLTLFLRKKKLQIERAWNSEERERAAKQIEKAVERRNLGQREKKEKIKRDNGVFERKKKLYSVVNHDHES